MHDFGIILGLTGLYFAIILGLVLYSRIKETGSFLPGLNEFFLAGKNLHPMVLTFTYVGSLFSTFSILGMPGLAYAHGIAGPLFVFIATIIGSTLLLYFGPKLRKCAAKNRIFSPLEIISQAYGSRRLGFIIALIFIVMLIPYISLQLVGVGKFMEGYTDGQIGYVLGVGSMMVIVLIYLFLGGMRAVAYTDFVQTIAIFFGLGAGLIFIVHHFDLTIPNIIKQTIVDRPEHLSLPGGQGFYTWPMFLSSIFALLGVWFQPHLLTRSMMASKDSDIRFMIIGSLIGVVLTTFFASFYGLSANILYGGDIAPNQMMGHVFKTMGAINLLGFLLSGLMLMGALGAAMSTADSLLISIGQISTRDVIRPSFKMSPERQILLSKLIMCIVLVFAFIAGLNPPRFMTDLALYSTAGSAVLMPSILCFAWKRKSLLAAYVSITLGTLSLIGAVLYKFTQDGIDPFGVHVGFFPMMLSFLSYFAISFFTYKEKKAKKAYA